MNFNLSFAILSLISVSFVASSVIEISRSFEYPYARRNLSVVDDFHGTKISDPYRWLEDPDSEETKQFVDAENKFTDPFLDKNKWQSIEKKLTQIWNYPKYGTPKRYGSYYYTSMNSGLQNQDVIYKQKTLDDEPIVFFDPNMLSSDGTVALSSTQFSEDGSLFAYAISESGSDWVKIRVRNVETGEDYPEVLERVKFAFISWTHDNKGFFYGRFPDAGTAPDGSDTGINENQKVYYHRVGQLQKEDILVLEMPENPTWRMAGTVSDCGKYFIVSIEKDLQGNGVFFVDLEAIGEINQKFTLTPIVSEFTSLYSFVANTGSKIVLHTNKDAPNYRLIEVDLNSVNEDNWRTLVAEDSKDVLLWAYCVDTDKIIAAYLQDVKTIIQVHSLETGKLIRKFTNEIGDIAAFSGSKKHSEIFYKLVSFLTPGTIYRCDFKDSSTTEPSIYREVKLNIEGFDKNKFKVEQVFYPSRDGTKIPMYIVQKKSDIQGPKPCLLYGYGGFNIALLPSFEPRFFFFINSFDGILAIPNIRGGGEYGEKWHNAGRQLNKQNSYDDFQEAAKFLVKNKYTEHKKIAIMGGSNGGLLVGASITQRPELFGAAIAQVGVMDLLRFHKFTIGHAWISDYGNPDEKIHFDNIIKFSPLHNVRAPNASEYQFPPLLITTGDHDDRVSPLHSLKFAATLQHAVRDNKWQTNPLLLRVYKKAGHGAGKPTAKRIEELSDIYTFLYEALDIKTPL